MAATKTRNRTAETNGKAETIVPLKQIDIRRFSIPIIGVTPLIVHKFSEKAKKQIEDKQQKKAKGAKEARDPNAEFLAALYTMPGSGEPGSPTAEYGIPAAGFKNAARSACRYVDGMAMTFARGAFHVLEDAGGLVRIDYDEMRMREDTVRLCGPGGVLDLRYRPEFTGWRCVVQVRYNAAAISPEQIVNLFNVAGFSVGLCEWRPEKNGSYGMFEVQVSGDDASGRA